MIQNGGIRSGETVALACFTDEHKSIYNNLKSKIEEAGITVIDSLPSSTMGTIAPNKDTKKVLEVTEVHPFLASFFERPANKPAYRDIIEKKGKWRNGQYRKR